MSYIPQYRQQLHIGFGIKQTFSHDFCSDLIFQLTENQRIIDPAVHQATAVIQTETRVINTTKTIFQEMRLGMFYTTKTVCEG